MWIYENRRNVTDISNKNLYALLNCTNEFISYAFHQHEAWVSRVWVFECTTTTFVPTIEHDRTLLNIFKYMPRLVHHSLAIFALLSEKKLVTPTNSRFTLTFWAGMHAASLNLLPILDYCDVVVFGYHAEMRSMHTTCVCMCMLVCVCVDVYIHDEW